MQKRVLWCRAILLCLLAGAFPGMARGQEGRDTLPGVRLGLMYETAAASALAIKPFTARFGGDQAAPLVEAIVARDLRYSDRFAVMDSLPASLVGEGVDYGLWDQIGATWLVSGQVEALGNGFVLALEVHDVVYAEVKVRDRFPLPDPSAEEFRMAVHRASDQIVEWITGEPGMAASRIAFSMFLGDTIQELFVVDSDGENMKRITRYGTTTMSPAWHPSAERIAYNSVREDGIPRIYELDLRTGREKALMPGREGQQMTPAYHPNGREVAFGLMGYNRTGLFSYDWERSCCLTHLQGGRWEDFSPAYSPDGTQIVFNSTRLGIGVPQIYVIDAREGGEADLVSPYVYGSGGYYTSPDWSPLENRVAFHGRVGRTGRYQILVAEIADRGSRVLQLTAEGDNQDPSWAPDGRHLVFAGERSYGYGLFVVDAATGRIRPLVSSIRPRNPEWSPSLTGAVEETLRGEGF